MTAKKYGSSSGRDLADPGGVALQIVEGSVREVGPAGAVGVGPVGGEQLAGVATRVEPLQPAVRPGQGHGIRARSRLPVGNWVTDRLTVEVRLHPPIITVRGDAPRLSRGVRGGRPPLLESVAERRQRPHLFGSSSWPRRLPVVLCFLSSSSSRNAIGAGCSSPSTRTGSSWSSTTRTRHRSGRSSAASLPRRRLLTGRLAAAAGRPGGGLRAAERATSDRDFVQFDELAAEGMLGLLKAAGGAAVARRILLPLISRPAAERDALRVGCSGATIVQTLGQDINEC